MVVLSFPIKCYSESYKNPIENSLLVWFSAAVELLIIDDWTREVMCSFTATRYFGWTWGHNRRSDYLFHSVPVHLDLSVTSLSRFSHRLLYGFLVSGNVELSIFKFKLPNICRGYWCGHYKFPILSHAIRGCAWKRCYYCGRIHSRAQWWQVVQHVLCCWQKWRTQGQISQGENNLQLCFVNQVKFLA